MILLLLLLPITSVSAYKDLFASPLEPEFFDIQIDRSNPQKLYKEFENFVIKYKKTYADETEKKLRFNNFVQTHNQIGKVSAKAKAAGSDTQFGINHFADLSTEEFKIRLSSIAPGNHSDVPIFNTTRKRSRSKRQLDNLPVTFDLRDKKIGARYVLNSIKNQEQCACCWAFAATAVAEFAHSLHKKKVVHLSDQEVCDCGHGSIPGCKGGDPTEGLKYIARAGQASEIEYPYEQNRSYAMDSCAASVYERELDPLVLTLQAIDPFNAEYQIMMSLVHYSAPVAVAFRVGESFRVLESGVLEMEDCYKTEEAEWHSLTIVGYGRTRTRKGRNVDYWIIKNSWATDWGEGGYARVARGINWCQIESRAITALIQ
ncbi:unnamed protein product [Caenorhabditis sp. 36 PRJEB53466]|nr:unnamed protein product [Caenorhabditis sp. 36 PRJEB53466]